MFNQPINNITFTIFDVETTGLSPKNGDRIIEIGALKIKEGKVIDELCTLVNPQRKNSAYFVNNISDNELEGAPLIKDILPDFLSFTKDSCLMAFNAAFDLSFIQEETRRSNIEFSRNSYIIDIMFMASRMLRTRRYISLEDTAFLLGLNSIQRHRSLDDCKLSAKVFLKLMDMFKDAKTFGHLYDSFGYKR